MRKMLPADAIHTAIRDRISHFHHDIVTEVAEAVARERIVVVGMRYNGSVRKARQNLTKAGLSFTYLEYGSYTSAWRQRLALKMWTGFPTFPMIFIDQKLIGGNSDLEALMAAGDITA